MTDMNNVDEHELLDYDEDLHDETLTTPSTHSGASGVKHEGGNGAGKPKAAAGYVGIHVSGFKDLLLKDELTRAIIDCGFEHPSQVQHEAIPQAVLGMDVICQAKSGMGKTAVFVLSTLHQLEIVDNEVHALVLSPTRELSYLISKEFERFSKHFDPPFRTAVFYGGVPVANDKKTLSTSEKYPHIVVGCPGRIKLLCSSQPPALDLSKVKHFILDECDQMLINTDMRAEVQDIFKTTPREKQVMMFSATLPKEIRLVCKKFMNQPLEIYVDDETKLTLHGLQQYYVKLDEKNKTRKLIDLIDNLEFNQVVIFVKNKQRATALNAILIQENFPSIFIHSNLDQEERTKRLESFKAFNARLLVSTDLMGRGIDIERINIVVNYDMPNSSDQYLHRVARAGRFGTKGLAISFISSQEDSTILNEVQSRFEVAIPEIPDHIETSTYMPNA